MIRDYSGINYRPDLVVCNNCGSKMLVDHDCCECPMCGSEGCLMDIEQEIDEDRYCELMELY